MAADESFFDDRKTPTQRQVECQQGPFANMVLLTWFNFFLIPVWISNHMPSKMWDEITYPFPNINNWNVEENLSHAL